MLVFNSSLLRYNYALGYIGRVRGRNYTRLNLVICKLPDTSITSNENIALIHIVYLGTSNVSARIAINTSKPFVNLRNLYSS